MENLIALVNSLKPGEIQLVRHLYSFKNNADFKKRDKLLKLILDKEITDEETALFILYGDKSYSALSQLKTRLSDDIMNVLLLQDPSTKYTALCAQASFDCRRSLVQGEILLARGVYGEALSLLSKASKLAKKYELYAELIQLDDLLRNHLALKQGTKTFTELSESIFEALGELNRLQRVKYMHYQLLTPHLVNNGKDYAAKGSEILDELKSELDKSGSVRARFYYHLAALNYYSNISSYEDALAHGTILQELVEDNPVVESRSNIAGAKMEIASIMLNLSRNTDALDYAQQSMQYFRPGMLNELNAMHKMFFAYFRENEMDKAEELLAQALKHKQVKYNEMVAAQWLFYKAALEFRKGDYQESLKTLKKDNTLTREKSSWLWSYYTLEIMNILELSGGNEWVDNKIEALKKVAYRNIDKIESENPRSIGVFTLLISLREHGYDFYQVSLREKQTLKNLTDGKGSYHWNPAGCEVIRFDEWMLGKIMRARKAG
jgi:tetratricopeptide (TPR) repeat protein